MSDITDALEALIAHPGWRLFDEYVRKEWAGAGYGRKVKDAVSHARTHGEDAAAAVDKVDYANDQIGALIGWPKQEAQRLKRQETESDPVHTPLPMELAAQTRRGSL